MSLVLSAGAIYAFTNHALHPVYSVSIATVLFLCWACTTTLGLLFTDVWAILEYDAMQELGDGYGTAPPSLLVIKDLFYVVVTFS